MTDIDSNSIKSRLNELSTILDDKINLFKTKTEVKNEFIETEGDQSS
jgi:hypothetical protein